MPNLFQIKMDKNKDYYAILGVHHILNYLLVNGFGWIHMEVCVAEREGFEPPVRVNAQ